MSHSVIRYLNERLVFIQNIQPFCFSTIVALLLHHRYPMYGYCQGNTYTVEWLAPFTTIPKIENHLFYMVHYLNLSLTFEEACGKV